jgi:hypothetical protein
VTLFELKAAAAAYLGKAVTDLTVNGVDLGLVALNQVRLNAELNHNFEFSRKLVSLSVSSATGGSLDNAVIYGTATAVDVKSIIDVGQFDDYGNLLPVEWTTVSESLGRQRDENPYKGIRYPTDGQAVSAPLGRSRFVFSGTNVYFYPKSSETSTFTMGFEAYTFTPDWVDADLVENANVTTGVPWYTKGHQYLLWASVQHLNNIFKEFVFRQEGNVPVPKDLADAGLASVISWDIFRYEQFRRHGR